MSCLFGGLGASEASVSRETWLHESLVQKARIGRAKL